MKNKTLKISILATIIVFILIIVTTFLFSVAIQPGIFSDSISNIVSRHLLLELNIFPVIVLLGIGYFITGNVFWGTSVPSFILLILSYVNLLKIEGREDAFVPADFGLIREAFNSAGSFDLDLHLPLLGTITLYSVGLFILGFLVNNPKPKMLGRVAACVVLITAMVLAMVYVYPDKDRYSSYNPPNPYNIPSVFNTLGFNYCFLYNYNLYPVDRPEGYDSSQVELWKTEYLKEKEATTQPNIIMVMGEAFSDISNDKVFAWPSETANPIYKFNQLTSNENAISGSIIVPNIAAGTANTEFDVLTGTPTNMVSQTATSSFRVVHSPVDTIATVLKKEGYKTSFLHPGNSWFYNRCSVYKYFGVDNHIFNDYFTEEDYGNDGLITDKAFLRELKEVIESTNNPQYIYSVTIQNHQAYTYEKFKDKTPDVPIKGNISDEAMEMLSVYLRGAKETSDMLYELVQYLDTLDEPTILVFFGDHLPNLGVDMQTYKELGMKVGKEDTLENTISAYRVPYLIYGNNAYCRDNSMEKKETLLKLPKSNTISSFYLGAMTLELAGYNGYDPYIDFLNKARKELPAFRYKENIYVLADGTYTNKLVEEKHKDIVKKIDWWQYYKLK